MTAGQARLLALLRGSEAAGRTVPTLREMAVGLGLRSHASVSGMLDVLEAAGLVARDGRRHRSVRTSGPAPGRGRPGGIMALTAGEAAWCGRNPGLVRAAMAAEAGRRIRTSAAVAAAVAGGGRVPPPKPRPDG